MKIKTITCHDVYNLGASLQAYALQHYLESKGHDVQIIDYKPEYLSRHYKLWVVANPIFDKPLIKQLYLLAKLPGRLWALRRKKVFDAFTAKSLKLTKRYNSYEELKADAPSADCYIAGSDQIWNTIFPNGRDAAFYMDFGAKDVKRISYAASFATPIVAEDCKSFVIDKLKGIDAVSIREKISLPLLAELGRADGVAVCDPVFLLSKEEWNETLSVENRCINTTEKYLLVYLTDDSPQIEQIARKIKQKTGWKVYSVGASQVQCTDKSFTNAGPLNFVQLIRDAQFVISNSFHATAFSLIMGTKFCVVNRAEAINERMKSILEDYGLSYRLVSEYNNSLLEDLNLVEVNLCMSKIIEASKDWLNGQLKATIRMR